jgi:aspartyl-tRNA(Asn)/glutamyl-tRNA(Gln) amidotransferase subunit C
MEIDVRHVADLVKIHLSPEEMREVEKDLRSILDHIARLAEIEVTGVPPTFGPAKAAGLRPDPDVPRPGLRREVVLKLAPASRDGNVLVPKEAPGGTGGGRPGEER